MLAEGFPKQAQEEVMVLETSVTYTYPCHEGVLGYVARSRVVRSWVRSADERARFLKALAEVEAMRRQLELAGVWDQPEYRRPVRPEAERRLRPLVRGRVCGGAQRYRVMV